MFKFLKLSFLCSWFRFYLFGFDDIVIYGAIALGASVIASRLNKQSVDETNEMNQRQFDQQMDFQRNSYKYTAQDLNNAGLNPALLATGSVSPSSAPSGSTFNNSDFSGIGTAATSLASTVLTNKSQQSIADGNNSTQKTVANKQGETALEVAAMNNSTQLALHSKDEDLKKAQIELLNKQAENAAASTREQERSTKYWEDVGADPSSSDKFKLTKEAASIITKAIKSSDKSATASGVSTVIDKYTKLGHSKFKQYYPTYHAFCRAISTDTGASEKTLMRERTLIEWYKSLKGE